MAPLVWWLTDLLNACCMWNHWHLKFNYVWKKHCEFASHYSRLARFPASHWMANFPTGLYLRNAARSSRKTVTVSTLDCYCHHHCPWWGVHPDRNKAWALTSVRNHLWRPFVQPLYLGGRMVWRVPDSHMVHQQVRFDSKKSRPWLAKSCLSQGNEWYFTCFPSV